MGSGQSADSVCSLPPCGRGVMRLRPPLDRSLPSPRGPWVPDLRSLALARPGHEILVSRATGASALARAERDTDLGPARDRHSYVRKSGKPHLRGPSARSAKRSFCLTESETGDVLSQTMSR